MVYGLGLSIAICPENKTVQGSGCSYNTKRGEYEAAFPCMVFEIPDSEAVIAAIREILLYGQQYGLKIPLSMSYICVLVLQC